MARDLFARVYFSDGKHTTLGHFINEIGKYMFNYRTFKNTEMNRETFLKLIEGLKKDPMVTHIEVWNGLDKGEYVNVHTGEVEQLWGFKIEQHEKD